MLKEVSTLDEGKSFGELALITDKSRAATCYVKSHNAVLGVLAKKDYAHILGDTFKQKMDKALEVISQFEIFNVLSSRRLSSLYYYFKEQ
jgi:hypothetical protein